MMHSKRVVALACAALLSVSFAASAQDSEESTSPFSASYGVTTDYVFRGVSQTDNGPAFQAGATYTAPFGLYVGVWGSNVDFGDGGPNFEVDYNIGWSKDLSDSWNLDLGVNRYTYEGASSGYGNINYNEYLAKVTWTGPVTVSGLLGYADDYSNTGAKQTYAALEASYDIGDSGFSVGASAGYTSIKEEANEWPRRADYYDGSVSVSKAFGPATATLGYYDTFGSDASLLRRESDTYKPGVVFTVSVDVP
ncbi:TorF family putative porin [Stenotrophomonas sp.]|uniref:TorF family putative porin n=1 Tax=Stenotrophomonas sp. TaxID=69392 RepID=UPI0028B07237|nr:TorF family putative porin [Stenotrophomonas sp.]